MRPTSPAALLQLQSVVGNRAVTALVQDRASSPPRAAATPRVGGPGLSLVPAPPRPASASLVDSPFAVPEVDAVSGASGSPSLAGVPRAADTPPAAPGGHGTGPPLPAPLTALSSVSAGTAPGMISVAAAGVTLLGHQLSVGAFVNALKGPVPTGLPVGPAPVMPKDPSIPEGAQPAPPGASPEAIAAAARGGASQLEAGRQAAEQAGSGDMGVGALAPTEAPGEIPPLGLDMIYPVAGPPPIATSTDPEVTQVLEHAYGPQARETASRELGGGQALLAEHAEAVEAQHAEAATIVKGENERATLEQVAAREEARMGVEQDRARLREENAEEVRKYQRAAAAEQTTAQAEVQRAQREAEAAEREESQEEDDEAWYERAWGAVKSGARAVGGAIKGAVVSAYRFVRDRVTRFFSKVRELVSAGISKIREIAGRIYRGIRDRIGRALDRIREIARRIGSFVADLVHRVGSFISGLISRVVDRFLRLVGAIADFWRKVWGMAVKVKDFLVMLANGAVDVVIELIENPRAVVEKARGAIQGLVDAAPGKIREIYQTHLAPILDARSPRAEAPSGAVLQRAVIQRQEAEAEPANRETHSEGIWRHLRVRGDYFLEHWWDVLLDAALEILVPGVAVYRHLPRLWAAMKEGWRALWAGEWSEAIDAGLEAGREAMAIFSTFLAQFSIAAFIVGSVLGTPVLGFAALEAIGWATIAIDASLQIATIIKSATNLDDADEDEKRLETDYGRVADSSIALAVMLALVLLGAIASKTASALVRRFPALGRAAEALKHKVRRGLGLKPRRPVSMTSKLKPLDPVPAEAVDLPIRSRLSAREQLAFDKWVADQRARKVDVERALAGRTPDQVRGMIRRQLEWLREQDAIREHNLRWEGEMLDPRMANGPRQEGGADVWSRWNEVEPSAKEIGEAARLNRQTGERVNLFGDDFPGIDGTIGQPPRPLQLKGVPASESIDNIPRVAGDAVAKARKAGFSRVEVSIEAPGRTVAQVRETFARNRALFPEAKGVSRVRVWCDDGVFVPTSFTPVIPPPHPDLDPDDDRVPAGAGAGR